MDPLVRDALDALEHRDWARLRLILHPYIHFSAGGTKLRGRTNVLAHVEVHGAPAPSSYELRDGQIYRWTV
jgi:hypothetical protein